jgi:hypothetical protein
MNKLHLFRALRHHIKLAEKRSVAYEQNKVAKVLLYIGGSFVVLYLVFIAIMLALIANTSSSQTTYEFLFGLLPFFLAADFLVRFISQQTPVQLIKPYSLLPISKYTCVEMFVLSSVVSPNNLVWTAVTVPYVLMTTLFCDGFWASMGIVVSFQLLVTVNSQWYMLVRTLINQSLKWWVLPIAVYALVFSPLYCDSIDTLFDIYSSLGRGFAFWHPLHYFGLLLVLFAFIELNKRMQFHFTYLENANVEAPKMRSVSEFRMFDRFGQTGEYLKLEIKSLIRNKNMRKSFVFSTLFTIFLSLVVSFTDLYQDDFSKIFWVAYVFMLYGANTLMKIMCAEGNYIDFLAVHKENIMQLLRAKYFFYGSMLVLPFLLMLPTVFTGKHSLLALFSMMCFTAGPVYCLFMQMAVYNRQTMPLNTKFISKGNVENNYFQIVALLLAMFLPVIVISSLRTMFSENTAYLVLLVFGIAFIATYSLWIANIYRRFMKRRYVNMESFRATR